MSTFLETESKLRKWKNKCILRKMLENKKCIHLHINKGANILLLKQKGIDIANTYYYQNNFGIEYLLYFEKLSGYFPVREELLQFAYSFGIGVIDRCLLSKMQVDKRVEIIITNAISLFFADNKNALLFVCDNSDNRNYVRQRKYDIWFEKYFVNDLEKYNALIRLDGQEIIGSMIIHPNNANRVGFIEKFYDFTNSV